MEEIPSVLAITVTDSNTTSKSHRILPSTQMLIGVRSEETNLTHPNIVSVPTQRLPSSLAEDILSIETESYYGNENVSGHNSMIYAVESLLLRKIFDAELIEANKIIFSVKFGHFEEGFAHYGEPISSAQKQYGSKELLRMINLHVDINLNKFKIPKKTASYSVLKWVSVKDFRKMMVGKDTHHVGLDPFGFCVAGLCVETSEAFLAKTLDI